MRRARQRVRTSAAALLGLALAGTAAAVPPVPSGLVAAQATLDHIAPGAHAAILRALHEGRYDAADSLAAALLAAVEPGPLRDKADSLALSQALEAWAASRVRNGWVGDPAALTRARRAVALREACLGREHPDLAPALSTLGLVLRAAGEPGEAVRHGRRAVRILEHAGRSGTAEMSRVLHDLGRSELGAGRHAAAESLLSAALEIQDRVLPPEHAERPALIGDHGMAVEFRSLPECRALYERAAAMSERVLGPDHPETAERVLRLGAWDMFSARYDSARVHMRRALAIAERSLRPGHHFLGKTLVWISGNEIWSEHIHAALEPAERALRILEEAAGPEHTDAAFACANLAVVLDGIGDPARARPLFERALASDEKRAPGSLRLANNLFLLGSHLFVAQEPSRARVLLERALAIRRRLLPADHVYLPWTMEKLGWVYWVLGREREAERLLRQAARLYPRAANTSDSYVARGLQIEATLAAIELDLPRSLECQKRLLAVTERHRGHDAPDVAWSLQAQGQLHAALGRPDSAAACFERAIETFERAGRADPAYAAVPLRHLGALRAAGGKPRAAFDLLARSVEMIAEGLRRNVRLMPEEAGFRMLDLSRWDLGVRPFDLMLHLATGPLAGDPDVARRALELVIRSRALLLDEVAARRHRLQDEQRELLRPLVERLAAASRRLSNLELRGGAAADSGYARALEEARSRRLAAERAMAERSAAFHRETERDSVGLEQVTASLPAASALVSFVRYEVPAPGQDLASGWLKRLGRAPPPPQPARYAAFVLAPADSVPRVVPLGSAERVERAVRRWKAEFDRTPGTAAAARARESAYRTAAAGLRRLVWDPVAAALPETERTFLVPDGMLHLVSFATLPASGSRYLVETAPPLHYLAAERDLATEGAAAAGTGGLLAVGAPDFDLPLEAAGSRRPPREGKAPAALSSDPAIFHGRRAGIGGFRDLRFSPLPGAARELRAVASLWQEAFPEASAAARGTPAPAAIRSAARVELLTGARATETAFKDAAPRHRLLHVATHGFFLGERSGAADAGRRGLGATVPANSPAAAGLRPSENPLLLSGLVFAGANRRHGAPEDADDGVLTAEEIAAMDLSGVEWAVLSACETGAGRLESGEGVLGLRRAFRIAGARTTIMSLWSIDDRSAVRWMRALYEARLLRGADTMQAMREASLAVLEERRRRRLDTHPFAWGAFVAVGEWR